MKKVSYESFKEAAELFYSVSRITVYFLLFLSLSLEFYEKELKEIDNNKKVQTIKSTSIKPD